jgi:hypothetical protein
MTSRAALMPCAEDLGARCDIIDVATASHDEQLGSRSGGGQEWPSQPQAGGHEDMAAASHAASAGAMLRG